jgi:hypothetical protein
MEGPIALNASQAFASYALHWLADNHEKFHQGAGVNEGLATELFRNCSTKGVNKFADSACDGGSATGAFVTFERRARRSSMFLNGGILGDCAVILLSVAEGVAHVISPRVRSLMSDPGGSISMGIGIEGPVWAFSALLDPTDLVFVTTDGVTDNIRAADLPALLPLIVSSSFFDEEPAAPCPCHHNEQPHTACLSHLRAFIPETSLQALSSVNCSLAGMRLLNFLLWTTREMRGEEEEYYALRLRLREKFLPGGAASRADLEARLGVMETKRATGALLAKTDDTGFVVLKPLHAQL